MIVGTAMAVKRDETAIALSDASRFSDRREARPQTTMPPVLAAAA